MGLVSNIVPDSGQPVYVNPHINGVRFTFKGAKGTGLDYIEGNMMPSSIAPGYDNGINILND